MRTSVILHSALPPSAAADALRRSIDEERRMPFSLSGYKGDRPVLGEVEENAFRLQKRRYGRLIQLGFAPHFYGQFEPEAGGTRVKGYFALSRWVKYLGFCLAGVGLLAGGPFFVRSLRDLTTGSDFMGGFAWAFLLYPTLLILFGVFLPQIGRLLRRSEEHFLLEHLQQALAARGESPESVRTRPMP